jgi:hypothetical protein
MMKPAVTPMIVPTATESKSRLMLVRFQPGDLL